MTKPQWITTAQAATKMGITPERVRKIIATYPKWAAKWTRKVHRKSTVYIGKVAKKPEYEIRADAPDPRKPHGRPRKDQAIVAEVHSMAVQADIRCGFVPTDFIRAAIEKAKQPK